MKSFLDYDWSPQIAQPIKDLAEAGFFYTGYGDATICFYCGCGLKKWLKDDDPYIEHAKWNRCCEYLRVVKRQAYINDVHNVFNWAKELEEMRKNYKKKPPAPKEETKEQPEIPEGQHCVICTIAEREIAFQPCGHLAACINCSFKITTCCICRMEIKTRLRVIKS
jgi:baculoviral IAP repeat-containing protein 7/8